ncbi:MAG TPA: hypothetical protein VHY08_18435 [Bacillota bacterium]|nr:hypothetical protein [Bacillota bacterium]
MGKAKSITVAGPDGEPVRIELVKKPKSKKKPHRPKESSVVASILEYLNGLPGVKAKKRHQNKYQRNQPDIDMCARVLVPGYMTDKGVLVGGCKADSFGCEMAVAYKFEVKKPGEECTPAQIVAQEEWKAVGVRVYVVYSKEEVREIMIQDGFDIKKKN